MLKLTEQVSFKQRALAGISVAVIVAGAYSPALAVAPTGWIYAGGATFPEKAYRDIMNCYGNHSGTNTELGLTSHICSTGDTGFTAPYKPGVQVLYAGVGSGNGKAAWINHDAAQLKNGNRVPDKTPVPSTADKQDQFTDGTVGAYGTNWYNFLSGTNLVDHRGTNNPFASISFVGSDDPLLSTDLVGAGKYNANSAANDWGPAIQVPALVGTVALMYNPASGGNISWTENGVAPAAPTIGTPSGVSLTTNTWCGIMTRAITDWNDAAITADNQGTSITGNVSAPITVVVRSDGSGTTFLMANAMIQQCAISTHPVPNSWQTAAGNALGVSNNSWFHNVNAAFPGSFNEQSGSGNVTATVKANAGYVGYASVDFSAPTDPSGPKAMNLQTYVSFSGNTTAVFRQPNKSSGSAIMVGTPIPPSTAGSCLVSAFYDKGTSPDGKCSHNPVNWGVTNPAPLSANAYPVGGFTFMFMYSCYQTAANGGLTTAPRLVGNVGKVGYLRWYFGTTTVNAVKVNNSLAKNGFGPIPPAWRTAVYNLLFTDTKTKIGAPGALGTACSAFTGSIKGA